MPNFRFPTYCEFSFANKKIMSNSIVFRRTSDLSHLSLYHATVCSDLRLLEKNGSENCIVKDKIGQNIKKTVDY